MNDLMITINSFTPAKVEFNYKEIEAQLDIVLDKYKGLVFTEETVADCKKTIAELRKGQKSVDDFRKETKKKLTESVTEFENECKVLYLKFAQVIDPLTEQADFFEVNRKEEKRKKVQEIVDNLIIENGLNDKYGKKLGLGLDMYLGSSVSMKRIIESLKGEADAHKAAQSQDESNVALIVSIVDKSNKDDEVNLLPDTYTRLLTYMDVTQVVARIYEDVTKLVNAREQEKSRIEALELKKLADEEEARLAAEAKLLEVPEEKLVAVKEYEEISESITLEDLKMFEESINPTEPMELIEVAITRLYTVTATQEELEFLEKILNGNFKVWKCINDGSF